MTARHGESLSPAFARRLSVPGELLTVASCLRFIPRVLYAFSSLDGAKTCGTAARATEKFSMPYDDPIYVLKSGFFRILGHPARVRILELLRDGERSVGDLQEELGLDSSGTSQHLGALRQQGLLESRRERTSVYYRVRDPRVFQLLEIARQILTSNLAEKQSLLDGLQADAPPAPN